MIRRIFMTFCLCALAWPADAEDGDPIVARLTAGQIEILLAGNTGVGTWSGSGYRQYFATGGMTIYVPDGGQADQGKWRVNRDTDQYESWWRMTSWTSYTVVMTNDGYAWVNGDTLEPFEVFTGKQMEW